MQLNLKRVLLTGAARGIGFEMAKTFAARGCEVVLTDRDAATLDEAREAIAATGSRCRSYAVDVTDHDSILAARDAVHRDLGRIDILVNNAGVVHGGPFLEVPLERHLQTYRVNVDGVVQMTHAFLPDLIASSRSQAVFIASASGFVGLPNGSTYASSKWAVIG
ncbi:MAG: SDR family NAD(P)-dependent oxidoreductase, partial [Acidobacteriota bacterium]